MLARLAVITRKELRQRLRDRSAVVLVVLAPLLIAAIMSGAFRSTENFHYSLGVVDADHGPAAAAIVHALEGRDLRGVIKVVPLRSDAVASREVADGTVGAALLIPPGFSAALHTRSPEMLSTDTSVNNAVAASTTAAVVRSFAAQLNADRLSVVTASSLGANDRAGLERAIGHWTLPLAVVDRAVGARALTPISYFAPAMAIFFLLFQVGFTGRSYFADVSSGMVDRMRVAPVRQVEIVFGKAMAAFVFSVVSLTIIAVTTTALFGASWGSPLPVALLTIGLAAVVACLCALVMVVARTQRQAEGIGSLVAFALALLGGNFVFVSALSPFMRRLALWTPNGWALRGFLDLSTVGGGVGRVGAPLVALAAFAIGLGTAAALLSRRAVAR